MRGRRILIVTPQPFFEERGTPIAVRHVAHALSAMGCEVDVLAFPIGTSVAIPNCRIIRTPNPMRIRNVPIGFSYRKLFLDSLLAWKLRGLLQNTAYDCVHAVEEAVFIAVALCAKRRLAVIYDMASSLPEQLQPRLAFRPLQPYLARMETWALRNVNHVLCSSGLREHCAMRAPGTPVQEWWFPANETSTPHQEVERLRAELKIPDRGRVLLYTGSFADYQGISYIMEAIPKVLAVRHDAFFVLVGASAIEAARMTKAIDPAVRSHVRIVARQSREKMPLYMQLADFLLSPRATGKNVPLKIYDYMASGKPILATRIHAHEALLDDTRAALFHPSSEQLARTILQLWSHPEAGRRLAANARRYAHDCFSWSRFIEFVGGVYASVLNCSPTAGQGPSAR